MSTTPPTKTATASTGRAGFPDARKVRKQMLEGKVSFVDHPLKRILEAGLVPYFRAERSRIVCPDCKELLFVYVHKEKNWPCFFICKSCAWYTVRPVLYDILRKAEQPKNAPPPNTGIDRQLRMITGGLLDATQQHRFKYQNLSGDNRNVKRPDTGANRNVKRPDK